MKIAERTLGNSVSASFVPAPVGRRAAAFLWDYLFIVLYLGVLRLAAFMFPLIRALFDQATTAHLASFVLLTLPIASYFAVCEASSARGTFGKRITRIEVQSGSGERLTFATSVLRTTVKFAPWELSHAAIWRYRFALRDATQNRMASLLLMSAWVLIVSNLICVAMDKRRRTLYDFASQSTVVATTKVGGGC